MSWSSSRWWSRCHGEVAIYKLSFQHHHYDMSTQPSHYSLCHFCRNLCAVGKLLIINSEVANASALGIYVCQCYIHNTTRYLVLHFILVSVCFGSRNLCIMENLLVMMWRALIGNAVEIYAVILECQSYSEIWPVNSTAAPTTYATLLVPCCLLLAWCSPLCFPCLSLYEKRRIN